MSALGPAAVLSREEMERVLGSFSCSPTSLRNRALVVLLYRAGLRCTEALELRRSDIRPLALEPYLRVRCGKGGKARTVGLHADVTEAIRRWHSVAPASDFVFCTLHGSRLDDGYVRAMLLRKAKQAGVKRIHPHAFRATLAVELVSEGVPLPAVRDVLGHSSLAITDVYLRRVFPEKAISAVINR